MGNSKSSAAEQNSLDNWTPGRVVVVDDMDASMLRVEPRTPTGKPSSSKEGLGKLLPSSSRQPQFDQISDPESRAAGTDSDRDGGHALTLRTTASRPMWYSMAVLLCIVACLVITAGARCGLDPECGMLHATPSLGHFLNSTDTSTLAGSALISLLATHYVMTVTTHHMVRKHTGVASLVMFTGAAVLYISVYACLIYPAWYIAVIPVVASVVWAAGAVHGLRCYYTFRPINERSPGYVSLGLLAVYAISALVYVVCSAIPLPEFPGKHAAVFSSQILLLVSGMLFIITLVIHTRGVRYSFEIVRVSASSAPQRRWSIGNDDASPRGGMASPASAHHGDTPYYYNA